MSFGFVSLRPDEFTVACLLASVAMQNSADDVCEIVETAFGFLIAAILSTLSRVSEICQTLSGFFSDGRDSLSSAYEISATVSRNFEARPNQRGALSQALQSAVWKPPFLEMTLLGSRLFQLLENLVKLLRDLRCLLSQTISRRPRSRYPMGRRRL